MHKTFIQHNVLIAFTWQQQRMPYKQVKVIMQNTCWMNNFMVNCNGCQQIHKKGVKYSRWLSMAFLVADCHAG